MHLIPNHHREKELCDAVGVGSVSELFADIPAHLRLPSDGSGLDLPDGEPERYLASRLRKTLSKNKTYDSMPIFLGGGCKPQHVPAAVRAVAHRQELINAYTPYQPEVSQGLLQLLFEYQSLMCDITQMEVVNASMYDGHTALGEAGLMCLRATRKRDRFLIPASLSWQKRSVLANYGRGAGLQVDTYAYDDATGQADLDDLAAKLAAGDVCGVYLENPNPFGIWEEQAQAIGVAAHEASALFVVGTDPTTLGIATPPGLLGADIVVGEASCFGGAPAMGGPHLGLFGCTEKLVRKMPGRLIGATHDENGKRGYVMTLQAREQHIRRSKATSNICSNETLMANQAAIHLSLLGRSGLRAMGLHNVKVGIKLRSILEAAGLEMRFSGPAYNEIVTRVPEGTTAQAFHDALLEAGVHGGLLLGRDHPDLADCILWGTTPVHSPGDFTALEEALGKVAA
ncbi:MAG: aminomethyl-transferring glycine dehydrogenase subunit GcvPA [Thermoplasmatota archaeon]